jgi:hypothetical protein
MGGQGSYTKSGLPIVTEETAHLIIDMAKDFPDVKELFYWSNFSKYIIKINEQNPKIFKVVKFYSDLFEKLLRKCGISDKNLLNTIAVSHYFMAMILYLLLACQDSRNK